MEISCNVMKKCNEKDFYLLLCAMNNLRSLKIEDMFNIDQFLIIFQYFF